MPSCLAVSLAMASASPVTILILTPIESAVAMTALASSRGGSNKGNTPPAAMDRLPRLAPRRATENRAPQTR
jgi:hypothetical protein